MNEKPRYIKLKKKKKRDFGWVGCLTIFNVVKVVTNLIDDVRLGGDLDDFFPHQTPLPHTSAFI